MLGITLSLAPPSLREAKRDFFLSRHPPKNVMSSGPRGFPQPANIDSKARKDLAGKYAILGLDRDVPAPAKRQESRLFLIRVNNPILTHAGRFVDSSLLHVIARDTVWTNDFHC